MNHYAYDDLTREDQYLLDRHILALQQGDYGKDAHGGFSTWPHSLKTLPKVREHVLENDPWLLPHLRDISRNHKDCSFLTGAKYCTKEQAEAEFAIRFTRQHHETVFDAVDPAVRAHEVRYSAEHKPLEGRVNTTSSGRLQR